MAKDPNSPAKLAVPIEATSSCKTIAAECDQVFRLNKPRAILDAQSAEAKSSPRRNSELVKDDLSP